MNSDRDDSTATGYDAHDTTAASAGGIEAKTYPHRRFNPLSGEWVLVSPHRLHRPWQGQVDAPRRQERPRYDPDCYLCPGNTRSAGARNPDYDSTYVFRNDFAALLPEAPSAEHDDGLLRSESVRGECRVVCFSPRHDLTLARMNDEERLRVVDLWAEQHAELSRSWHWVQVFENRGEMMGASNPHPHGQIWALDRLPLTAGREDANQRRYLEQHGGPLLLDYARLELERAERVVEANDDWLAVVPYWAVWPYETLLLPLFPVATLSDLGAGPRRSLALILGRLLTRYDNLFSTPFPYSMGWHGAPGTVSDASFRTDRGKSHDGEVGGAESHHRKRHDGQSHGRESDGGRGNGPQGEREPWQLHAHFYPPLLRSAGIRKFMVGFELLGEPQRDLTPEAAAEQLRSQSLRHYLEES